VQRTLEAPRILIADGHHRYETALEYWRALARERAAGADESPDAYTMITLVPFDDPGLVILPTHRLVRKLPAATLAGFAASCRRDFLVDEFSESEGFLTALRTAGRDAIGVALKGDRAFRLLRIADESSLAISMSEVPAAVRELDVSLLHVLILERIFGIGPDEIRAGGNIEYTIDAQAALAEVIAGSADGAFLMNAPTVEDIERVSSAGATMPEKSTYFFPKLITGLVMNPLED
jgi:uncharacterized protein (DUF1015 family)